MAKNNLLKQPCEEEEDGDKKRCSYYRTTYTMHFDIDNVSVLRRRQKPNLPCIENWRNDDVEVKSEISRSLKCQPNHWSMNLNLTSCKTQSNMSQSLSKEENPENPSCYGIERYSYSYNEMAGLDLFDLGFDDFIELLGMNWNETKLNGTVISEIMISFVGM